MSETEARQGAFADPQFYLPQDSLDSIRDRWPHTFRVKALPIIEETMSTTTFSADVDLASRDVRTMLGVLLIKEMHNLTDLWTLESAHDNMAWHHALAVHIEEVHLVKDALQIFRVMLIGHDAARRAYAEIADRVFGIMDVHRDLYTDTPRPDSGQVVRNMVVLCRLKLFCEATRGFLRATGREHPELASEIRYELVRRYTEDYVWSPTYEDALRDQGRRRLAVCARDSYRLVNMFRGTPAARLGEYEKLRRVLHEQCHVGRRGGSRPRPDDDDAGEGRVPVSLRNPKAIPRFSIQSPHHTDPA